VLDPTVKSQRSIQGMGGELSVVMDDYNRVWLWWKNTITFVLLSKSISLFPNSVWRNIALYHLLTNGSSAVNGCRRNESLIKTS